MMNRSVSERFGVASQGQSQNPKQQTPASAPPPMPDFNKTFNSKAGVPTREVKLKNHNAMEKEKEDLERQKIKQSFDESVEKTIQYDTEIQQRTADITKRFLNVVEDKTLPQNKKSMHYDIEKQIRNEMIQLGVELNNNFDPREPSAQFGTGSICLIALLMKVVLNQREKLNVLEYELKSLKKDLGA